MEMNLKIRDKIIGIMVILIVLPIFFLGWTSYRSSSKALRIQYEEMGTIISGEVNALIQEKIAETNKTLLDLSSDDGLFYMEEDEEERAHTMEQFQRTRDTQGFIDVYFGTTSGRFHMASGAEDGTNVDPRERPWYINATKSDDIVWSEVYKDGTSGVSTITASRAVYDGSTLKGVVAIDIDLQDFSKMVTEVDVQGGTPIIVDSEGIIIVEKDPEWIGKKLDAIDEFEENVEGQQVIEYSFVDEASNKEIKELIIFAPVKGTDWRVATIIGMDAMDKVNSDMRRSILLIGLTTVVIGVLIAIAFGRHMSESINQILEAITKMEKGDFTSRINTNSRDEFGQVRDHFNSMMETLSVFITNIKTASTSVDEYSGNLAAISEEVRASSLEVATTADEIAKGASNQADDTEHGVTLINHLSDKLVELDKTSDDMVHLAEEIRVTSRESVEVVEDLKEKTQLNNESSESVGKEIVELDKRISEVTGILSTIDAISEQTNLLALNASIEAARAGEYGKGFAVVADEIRQLAGESKASSSNIKSIIEAVQTESKKTVNVMGQVNEMNLEQTQAVERVNHSFGTINNLIEQIVDKIKDIDDKSTEMNEDRNEIVRTIENISAISQETAAASEEVTASIEQQTSATEEVAEAAGKLNELSNQLNREISVFKI